MGQLAPTHNPSGLVTAPVQPPPALRFLVQAPPVWCVTVAPHPETYITGSPAPPRGERPPQLAALTLIDLAPVLTQTPGETFFFPEGEAPPGEEGVEASRSDGVWGGKCVWVGGTRQIINFLLCLQCW